MEKTPPQKMKELINIGRLDEAIELGADHLNVTKGKDQVLHYLGDCFRMKKDLHTAERFYRKALLIDESRPWTLHNLAITLDLMNNSESVIYHKRAVSVSNNSEFLCNSQAPPRDAGLWSVLG